MTSKTQTYDLTIGEDIRQLQLGITKMSVVGYADGHLLELHFYNGEVEPIKVPYNKDLVRTTNDVKQAFTGSHLFDDNLSKLDGFAVILSDYIHELKRKLLSQSGKGKKGKGKGKSSSSHRRSEQWDKEEAQWNEEEAQDEEKSEYEEAQEAKITKIRADVERVRNANIGISPEVWRDGLVYRYNYLLEVVNENIPEMWSGLEFALASHRILNIHECTLPFIGVILARPGSYKTVILNMITVWDNTFYTDNFSTKALITHTTAVDSEEKLKEIDMLPKIKDRHFLTPELAPIFTTDEKELGTNLGIITRIADGHGLALDSGAHGHRAYGDTMFVWTGAAVDIPYKVYKLLGNLGFKIYFYRLPILEKTEDGFLTNLKQNFNKKKANIQAALYEYFGWFEIGPHLLHDEQSDLSKIQWDDEKDEEKALVWIIKLGILLSHLRCIAQIWDAKDGSQGSNYGYAHSQPESPERAMEVLKNLARGHALLTGRNFITLEDIPIVIKTTLSTAIIDRVGLLYLLMANKGTVVTREIVDAFTVNRHTALRRMAEFWVIGLVDKEADTTGRYTERITLKEEFQWLLEEDFQKLSEGFKPVDYRPFMKDADKSNGSSGPKSKVNGYSTEQKSVFWRVFGELEDVERRSNPEVDKITIQEEDLQDGLVSAGKFTTSDAAMIIKAMKDDEFIEQVDDSGTLRRKVKSL